MKRTAFFLLFSLVAAVSTQSDTTRIFLFGPSFVGSSAANNGRTQEFSAWSKQTGTSITQKMQISGDNYSYEIEQSWKETHNKDTIALAKWDLVIYDCLYKPYISIDSFYKYHALYI